MSDQCDVALDISCPGSWLQAGYRVGGFAKVRGEKSEGNAKDLRCLYTTSLEVKVRQCSGLP